MKIAVGSDHAGFELKEKLKAYLAGKGHEILDLGTNSTVSVDYPDFGFAVGKAVASGRAERGVIACGTGIGIAIAANKVKGVRAGVPNDLFATRLMREHNDANVISFGARQVAAPLAEAMLDAFLETAFAGGRHTRRVEKLNAAEPGGAAP
jgi:ribose 5-phosphate isomerase B